MKAISAPKLSICAPRSKSSRKAPMRLATPTNMTLLRGTWCLGSIAPKNDLGSALLRPMPNSRRAAPSWAPIPEPKFATTKVNPTMPKSGVHFKRRKDADDHAGEHGGQQDVAPGILGFLRQRGDAVEADIGEHRDGGASKHGAREGGGVVERPREERRPVVR